MASSSMHGLVEDPIVLETTISFPICGEGLVSSSGALRLGNVLPSTPTLCDIPVCSLLPRKASPHPSVVVSSSGHIMESLSSLLPREVSPHPSVVVVSSGNHSKSVERFLREHGISSSRVVQSESSLTDSHVELGFVTVAPWPNQVEVEVSDLNEVK
ncbi:hypothetical protein LWI29_008661 [Acer saccharum]|uniref:Uncharacterized protein n=1 Tax=Acer saccharum TaxID=4024 RepID=A0AA39W896_ACESA|nr:hypothetical protein LWI29_008661 [Acer saccharum]